MGRLFLVLLLSAGLLLTALRPAESAQTVFFRMIFPQLPLPWEQLATPDEADAPEDEGVGEVVLL